MSSYRTLILRVERTDGLNGTSALFAAFSARVLPDDIIDFLHLSSDTILLTGAGLNSDVRLWLAFCRIEF